MDRRGAAHSGMQRKAFCNTESFHALSSYKWLASHRSLGSSQSVRRHCGKGNVDRRGPRSFEHARQGTVTCCNNESVHALSSHEWIASHGSLGSSHSVRLAVGRWKFVAWLKAGPAPSHQVRGGWIPRISRVGTAWFPGTQKLYCVLKRCCHVYTADLIIV